MANKIETEIETAVENHFKVPSHIMACASAIRYDLMHGPSFAAIPNTGIESFTVDHYASDYESLENMTDCKIEETYIGIVAQTLRDYISNLPSEMWYDSQCGYLSENEPEGYEDDETGEWIEPEWSDYYKLERSNIVAALFGKTIAKEFD